MVELTAEPGVKMHFLISRRPGVSRDELVANWFANHMPDVIAGQHRAAEAGKRHAWRYIATLYEPVTSGDQVWDGVAQLWWDEALPRSAEPHGTEPRDTFQQKAMPYSGWPTTEHVVIDGELPFTPNTLNQAYPFSRSGFVKLTSILTVKPGVDLSELYRHWLEVHAPNVAGAMERSGGFRYVISTSIEPGVDPYAGMAELYFPDDDSIRAFGEIYENDGLDRFADALRFRSTTEFVGIP